MKTKIWRQQHGDDNLSTSVDLASKINNLLLLNEWENLCISTGSKPNQAANIF